MKRRHCRQPRRRAATIVEAAVVLAVVMLLLFGVLEYARYLSVLHVADNAAREGARYAVVNTTDNATQSQVISVVTSRMAGMDSAIQNYKVNVFTVDMSKIYNTSTNQYLYPTSGPNATQLSNSNWNDAQYGQLIAVQITGTYNPILPSFLQLGSLPVNVICVMNSEAN